MNLRKRERGGGRGTGHVLLVMAMHGVNDMQLTVSSLWGSEYVLLLQIYVSSWLFPYSEGEIIEICDAYQSWRRQATFDGFECIDSDLTI